MPTAHPLLLGHRGARRYAPENTIAAFELALEHGCDGFELDIRRASDGELVCFHDACVAELQVAEATPQQLSSAAGIEVPAIGEVLERFGSRAFINIELKIEGMEDALLQILERHPAGKGLLVSSFLPQAIEAMHRAAPHVPLGYICDQRNPLGLWRSLPISHLVLHHGLMSQATYDEARSAKKDLFVWTLNSAPELRRFAAMGVDGIISDDTLLLADVLRHA